MTVAETTPRVPRTAAREEQLPDLLLVNKALVLHPANLRWQNGDIGVLHENQRGYGTRDMDAYALVHGELYGIHRSLFFGHPDGSFRVFLGSAPPLIDLSGMVPQANSLLDRISVTSKLKQHIIKECARVRESIIDFWVNALLKTPQEWNLSQLLKHVAPLSISPLFAEDAILNPVLKKLGWDRFADSRRVYELMTGAWFTTPTWAGNTDVQCQVYMAGNFSRSWVKVVGGVYTPMGSRLATLKMTNGPLAVVTASSEDAREHCERLIENNTYGDVVLLIGEGKRLKEDAQRMSDHLFGVDIIHM